MRHGWKLLGVDKLKVVREDLRVVLHHGDNAVVRLGPVAIEGTTEELGVDNEALVHYELFLIRLRAHSDSDEGAARKAVICQSLILYLCVYNIDLLHGMSYRSLWMSN